jgi:hypothetical protein
VRLAAVFFFGLSSEWLKQRRSLTRPLVIGSACFIPAIIFLSRFRHIDALPALYRAPRFWEGLWRQSWEAMALMILPLAIMLMASLIAQIEYRSNAWKQLHATPQPLAAIFAAKLVVLLVRVAQLILWFNVAIYAAGALPALLFDGVSLPGPLRIGYFLDRDVRFFVDVLPIVALQYVLAILFRSFLAPLGIGMALWIFSVGTMSWRYSWIVPYSAASLDYLSVEYQRALPLPVSPPVIAFAWFFVFTVVGYVLYSWKRERG